MLALIGPVKLRLQVMRAGASAMGPGRAAVLEAIMTAGPLWEPGGP